MKRIIVLIALALFATAPAKAQEPKFERLESVKIQLLDELRPIVVVIRREKSEVSDALEKRLTDAKLNAYLVQINVDVDLKTAEQFGFVVGTPLPEVHVFQPKKLGEWETKKFSGFFSVRQIISAAQR